MFTLTFAVFTSSPSLASAANLTIDPATTFQTVEGFGTCLPWWVNDPSTSPFYGSALRSNYVKDLGLNILRVEMHPSALMGAAGTLDSSVTATDSIQESGVATGTARPGCTRKRPCSPPDRTKPGPSASERTG